MKQISKDLVPESAGQSLEWKGERWLTGRDAWESRVACNGGSRSDGQEDVMIAAVHVSVVSEQKSEWCRHPWRHGRI
jgi:hypothetical protein